MPEYLITAWFGNAVFRNWEGAGEAEINLDTINGFPYTIKKWYFDNDSGLLILGIWFDDYVDSYYKGLTSYGHTKVMHYTVLELQDNKIYLYTTDEAGSQYHNITTGSDIVLSEEDERQLYSRTKKSAEKGMQR